MESIKPIKPRISEKLADPEYFSKFFDERTRDEVATQLRELRELRELSQVRFAGLSGMHQSAVSRIEQSDYSGWTYKTLLRAAMTLRARLKIEFIPAEKVIDEYREKEDTRDISYKVSETIDSARLLKSIPGTTNYGRPGRSVESVLKLVSPVSSSSSMIVLSPANKVRMELNHGKEANRI